MDNSIAIQCLAQSCVAGGAKAIRTNLEHVKAIAEVVDVPLIGIKKSIKEMIRFILVLELHQQWMKSIS